YRHPDRRPQRAGTDSPARSGKAGFSRHDCRDAGEPHVGQYRGDFAKGVNITIHCFVSPLTAPCDICTIPRPAKSTCLIPGGTLPAPKSPCVHVEGASSSPIYFTACRSVDKLP